MALLRKCKKNVWSVDEAWDRNVHTVRWESALTAKVQAQYVISEETNLNATFLSMLHKGIINIMKK